MSETAMRACMGRYLKRTLAIVALLGIQLGMAGQTPARAETAPDATAAKIADTTSEYISTFYPLWFTNYQWDYSTKNRFVGPDRVTPAYKAVVAINVDTLYASTIMSLKSEPIVVTLPKTKVSYSILSLDAYGNVFTTDISATPGTYVLTGPDFSGSVPHGLMEVEFPVNHAQFIIRADRYSVNGVNQEKQARRFRKNLSTQTLSQYKAGDTPNKTLVLPEAAFATPFKSTVDIMMKYAPIEFLKMLQDSVKSDIVPDLNKAQQKLSDKFDGIFNGGSVSDADKAIFVATTIETKKAIQDKYKNTRGSTNWTHFNNIGNWKKKVLDRAAITEFCQYCNTIKTAAYYHAFYDKKGKVLDGSKRSGYVLKFKKKQIPDVSRFWSLTAYTPDTVELIDTPQEKYAVASYTRGLKFGKNGSVSIYIAPKKPAGVPKANWLPVSNDEFNVMLRLYGPEGDVESYEPPAIKKR